MTFCTPRLPCSSNPRAHGARKTIETPEDQSCRIVRLLRGTGRQSSSSARDTAIQLHDRSSSLDTERTALGTDTDTAQGQLLMRHTGMDNSNLASQGSIHCCSEPRECGFGHQYSSRNSLNNKRQAEESAITFAGNDPWQIRLEPLAPCRCYYY